MAQIIDGKYEIIHEIGRGGMSIVYQARDLRLNKQWAIKEFRKDKDDLSKEKALEALRTEANLMKKLDHPTLPRVVDIIDENQSVYVVMDYIEGESLNKVLDAYGAQPQEAVIEWAKQLAEVLDYLHTQNPPVIYRDMKPANIMLKPDGTVRLIDFGIAREYKEGKAGDTEAIGTRGYAAPEQFGGKGQTDARTDIYSLGVTLYHLVTGKNPTEPPYEIYPIRHWNPSLSSGLEWLIQKCTQLNPEDRYQSCAEVLYVLQNLSKFEDEYKRSLKGKINLFLTTAILTGVMALASVGCLVGAANLKANTIESFMAEKTVEGYVNAIGVDSENPEPYVALAKLLGDSITNYHPGAPTAEDQIATITNSISEGDRQSWFPYAQMSEFRTEYPEEYARIQFELGWMIWNNYRDANGAVNDSEAIAGAQRYFQQVILMANQEGIAKNAGLTDREYNTARVYYLVSYFQANKDKLDGGDLGEFAVEEEVVLAGIAAEENNGTYIISDPYRAFWDTNLELLNVLGGDADMTDAVKLKTLKKIAYILQENHLVFINEADVTEEMMRDFINRFDEVFDSIHGDGSNEALKQEVQDAINRAIKSVAPLYGQNTSFEEVG